MIQPDHIDDATLEYAARLVEGPSFADLRVVMARKKRAREDADLRYQARLELKAEIAAHLRAMKHRRDLDAMTVLARLAELSPDDRHDIHLRDAWPLAWKGWLRIDVTVCCTSNSIPPEARYQISLTEKGRAILEKRALPALALNS